MIGLVNNVKEQVYSLLFFVRHNLMYVPAFCLISTIIAFISHILKVWGYFIYSIPVGNYEYSETYLTIYTLCAHYFDPSAVTLLLLSAMSFYESWGKVANYPLYYLWIMWLIVHYDIAFMPEHDIIFYCFLSLLYPTFLYLCVKSLINRNK